VAENLDEISDYIAKHGIDVVTKKDFSVFLGCVDNTDKNVRENGLKVMGEAYSVLGEDIWRLLGKDLPLKVKSLLEARFKSVVKKAGGALAMSLNNSRGGKEALNLTGAAAKKRAIVDASKGLNLTGLKFNKPSDKSEEESKKSMQSSIKDSEPESVNTKMNDLDPFGSKPKMMQDDPFASKNKMANDDPFSSKPKMAQEDPFASNNKMA